MIISSKSISLSEDKLFNVVINGNTESTKVIILVHGFGVRSESRGLFTSIEKEFINNYLIVRPDFAQMEEEYIRAIPFSVQARRLQAVLNYLNASYPNKQRVFIGHSQGCFIISQVKPHKNKIIFLAPPIGNVFNDFITSPGWKYIGSHLNLKGESKLLRSDNTLILVNSNFWNDFKKIDTEKLYLEGNKQNTLVMVIPENDYMNNIKQIPGSIKKYYIKNANPDFKNETRYLLTNKLKELL